MHRFLIVDDHAVLRRGLLALLREEYPDLQVGEAKDAREATILILQQEWDLVVLDINMPGPSGLEVLAEIRRQNARAAVLVLSAYSEQEIALRAFQLGAAGYLN